MRYILVLPALNIFRPISKFCMYIFYSYICIFNFYKCIHIIII